MRLKNKVAVVTGAASGIGKAIAENFLTQGAEVVYSDINKPNDLIKSEYKQNSIFVKCDVSKSKQVQKLVEKTVEKFGKLDIMVNNAGIGSLGTTLEETDENWNKVLSVNLSGAFYGLREAANYMKENKIKGAIINMSSMFGTVGFQNAISYCAFKVVVVQLTQAGSLNLAPFKIRVNAIAPAFIKTNMTEDVLEDKNFQKMVKSSTPLGHVGDVQDIADAAIYLASDESKYVTGEVLHVDGGWTAR